VTVSLEPFVGDRHIGSNRAMDLYEIAISSTPQAARPGHISSHMSGNQPNRALTTQMSHAVKVPRSRFCFVEPERLGLQQWRGS